MWKENIIRENDKIKNRIIYSFTVTPKKMPVKPGQLGWQNKNTSYFFVYCYTLNLKGTFNLILKFLPIL